MSMYSPLKTRFGFWHKPGWVIGFVMAISLMGCATSSPMAIPGENQRTFIEALARAPAVCQSYRQAYVSGFSDNVKALAANDAAGQRRAQLYLSDSRKRLMDTGLSEVDCSRPYCIIEPLQNGRLNSWCGYRLEADEGTDLYQWLDWGSVQTALRSLQ